MAVWGKRTLEGAEDAIAQFGRDLRFARTREGLSQMSLEGRSGVDQTLISRLERAKAPHVSLERLIRSISLLATACRSATARTTINAPSATPISSRIGDTFGGSGNG